MRGRVGAQRSSGAHGPFARCVLLCQQDSLDPRQRAWCSRRRRTGKTCIRHHRLLAYLDAHARACACDRRDQRQPYHALQHSRRLLGSVAFRALRHSCIAFARSAPFGQHVRRDHASSHSRWHSYLRRCGRPTGSALRPVLLFTWSGEEYVWYGLLFAYEYGCYPRAIHAQFVHDYCGIGAGHRAYGIRPGRKRFRGGRAYAVATR